MMDEQQRSKFMQEALRQAKKAFALDEVPIGAVVVDADGNIIGRGYNRIERKKQQTAHAEVIAIQRACKKINNWRLNGCWIFVTLEPCLMCLGLIALSRCKGIIYGAKSNLFGVGLDKFKKIPFYSKDILVEGGCKAEEGVALLENFFKQARGKKRKGSGERKSFVYR